VRVSVFACVSVRLYVHYVKWAKCPKINLMMIVKSNSGVTYRVAQKTGTLVLYALTSYVLTSSNIDRFSKLFHYLNQENICNNTITKDPTTPQVCRYTTL